MTLRFPEFALFTWFPSTFVSIWLGDSQSLDQFRYKPYVQDIKRLDSDISAIKEDIKEIKGSQKAQIWTLIGIVITAVIGLIGALGKIVFFPNP
ncbi:hemolysin XhlA family protein [Pleurocapsales cyanobacterium LEGE 06147]|nr:hemolysin XhlA family protein [Pleurocapsales cyanobacterium LEGE 06147]